MEERASELTIDHFAHRLSSYLEPSQISSVKRAYYYAEQAHVGQFRRSGEEYITHPLQVANILASIIRNPSRETGRKLPEDGLGNG